MTENTTSESVKKDSNVVRLLDEQVQTEGMKDDTVSTEKIKDLAVTNAKIDNLAVTNAKIDSMSAGKIIASTLIVAVDVGTGAGSAYVRLDGANNRIVVHDGTVPRIVIGNI